MDNPFFGLGTGGFFASPKISRGQLLRPYPQFTDIIPLYSSGASSNYHALQVSFSKRLSRGILIDGNYTWAKNIEEGLTHQDSYNIRGDRGLSTIDIAHRFVISYLYELPFGKGRKFGANAPGLLDAIIGGWQFNGITTFQSGTPLTITANNTAGLFNPLTRPNTNGKDPQPQRQSGRTAKQVFRHERLQPARGVHIRERRTDGEHPQRRRQELRSVTVQTIRADREDARTVPGRGAERVQHAALRLADYERHVDDLRSDHIAGEFPAATAVRFEDIVVAEAV